LFLYFVQKLQAVHSGHANVGHQQIIVGEVLLQGGRRGGKAADVITVALEHFLEKFTGNGIVINHYYAGFHKNTCGH